MDRPAPQDIPMEKSLLGACLTDRRAVDTSRRYLSPTKFHHRHHREVFAAICALADEENAIDTLTVCACLEENGRIEAAGGHAEVVCLASDAGLNVEAYAKRLNELHMRRQAISLHTKGIDDCHDEKVSITELQAKMILMPDSLGMVGNRGMVALSDLLEDAYQRMITPRDGLSGIPTGLFKLDDNTDGWQRGELILVAGRPSMGKTRLGLHMLRAATKEGQALLVSAEMGTGSIVEAMMAAEARVNSKEVRRQTLDEAGKFTLQQAKSTLEGHNILICEDTQPIEIMTQAQEAVRRGASMVMIDYLQLLQAPEDGTRYGNREQEVAATGRFLKRMARKLDIPVIAMAQINRANEGRSDKRPMLGDLRESGALEQDADIVMALHRPFYYGETQREVDGVTEDVTDLCELLILKNRNGPTGIIQARMDMPSGAFASWGDASLETQYDF